MNRPRDELGDLLRKRLRCPMCSADPFAGLGALAGDDDDRKPLRVVAYRKNSVRLACRTCGMRFSIDVENFADTVAERQRPPAEVVEREAQKRTADDPGEYLTALAALRQHTDRLVDERRRAIRELQRRAVAAEKPRRGQIRFPKRNVKPTRETTE